MPIKKCPGCGFHFQMLGRTIRCEPCSERHKKAARETPEAAKKNLARTLTKRAIAEGQLVRNPCEECGSPDVHAHHVDYEQPLNVRWLCATHHILLHHDLRFRARLEQHGHWNAEEIEEIMERRRARA